MDSTTYQVEEAFVARDSTMFTETGSRLRHAIPTHDLLSIENRDYGAGAISGGLLGSLTGLTTGIIIWAIINDHSPDSGLGGFALTLGGIAGGAIIGVAVGLIEGSTQMYMFQAVQSNGQSVQGSTGSATP